MRGRGLPCAAHRPARQSAEHRGCGTWLVGVGGAEWETAGARPERARHRARGRTSGPRPCLGPPSSPSSAPLPGRGPQAECAGWSWRPRSRVVRAGTTTGFRARQARKGRERVGLGVPRSDQRRAARTDVEKCVLPSQGRNDMIGVGGSEATRGLEGVRSRHPGHGVQDRSSDDPVPIPSAPRW